MFETVEDSAVKRQLQTSKNKSGLYSTQPECGNDPFFKLKTQQRNLRKITETNK
jgi:hypothetical protein